MTTRPSLSRSSRRDAPCRGTRSANLHLATGRMAVPGVITWEDSDDE